ncbi:MAG: SpoIVB peptidase S55 domain-containing protein [Pyrinomonadaceae bacterium]
MIKAPFFGGFVAVLLVAINGLGQFQKVADVKTKVQIFPVSELREGMRGTARTVFRGNQAEEFNVEILGVIPNWIGPKQDMIIGKLSGSNAERTFVFSGMSGSPVYINGKLVGAISYSFPFAKEPICGITPFDQMSSVVEQAPSTRVGVKAARAFSIGELAADTWHPEISGMPAGALASGFQSNSRLMAIAGQTFTPISTPVAFSGISQQVLDQLAPQLMRVGLLPVAAAGGDSRITSMKRATETTLLGGDSVVVHLARGDIQIAAAGTVTLRDGDKIYAFGHPFFGLGTTDLPMSESHVVTVVPNANNSFKLTVPDATVGSMTQDRATTVYGKLGQQPRMLPVKIRLTTSRGRTEEINFESVFDELLTPLIINAGVSNALIASERGIGESTIELNGEIRIKGEESIRLNRRFAGAQASVFASSAAVIPLGALLRADFPGMEITGVSINMTAVDGSQTAVLDHISVDKKQVRPGETVEVTAYERNQAGQFTVRKIRIAIPNSAAVGTVSLIIGDGNAVQQSSAITQFVPRSVADLINTFNRLKRPDRLYAVLTRSASGTVIGSSEMPNLPPSMMATINNDRTAGGLRPSVQTIVAETQLPAGDHIVAGSQTVTIEIIQ